MKTLRFTCLSASNIRHFRQNSTSLRVCSLIQNLLLQEPHVSVDVIPLVDYDLSPCIGCGACFRTRQCEHDPVFNSIYQRLIQADGLFIVAAHYAPIPAKLCMVLEKIEQIAFLPRFHDESIHSPLYHKPVGIIGHCGGTAELLKHGYQVMILDTITNALGWPVEMDVISVDNEDSYSHGILFPVSQISRSPENPFPLQEYDWEDIQRRITPLVHQVYLRASGA